MSQLILLIIFLENVLSSSPTCFGYISSLNECLTCSFSDYPSLSMNRSIPPSLCQPKKNIFFQMSFYISNQTSCTNSVCNGSINNPFLSIFNAFEAANALADPYSLSELSFFLIGSPHYILIKDLSASLLHLFRRVNAKMFMSPLYCDQSNIKYCFNRAQNNVFPLIYVKTSEFFIFVANSLTIENIAFDGRDLPFHSLSGNSSTACYNLKKVCCSDSSLKVTAKSTNVGTCAIYKRSLNRVFWQDRSSIYGMINLEGLFDDVGMDKPILILNNVNFSTFYPVTLDNTWITLLYFNDIPSIILMENVTFFRGELYFGFMFSYLANADTLFMKYGVSVDIAKLTAAGNEISMLMTNISKYNDMLIANSLSTNYYDYRFWPIIYISNFAQPPGKNSFFLIQNLYIEYSVSPNGNKNTALCLFQSTNISIYNYTLFSSLDIMPLNIDTCDNITFINFTIDNANNIHELVWVNAAHVVIYNFNFTSILFPKTTSGIYLSISIYSNSFVQVFNGNFYNLTYANINLMNSTLILNNVLFKDFIYYASFFWISGARLSINNSNISNFSSISQNSFMETNVSLLSPNIIGVVNTRINASNALIGQLLLNKLNNPSDLFIFKNLQINNSKFAFLIKATVLSSLYLMDILISNNSNSGQYLNVGEFSNHLTIFNVYFENCVVNNSLISVNSLKGNLTVKALGLINTTVMTQTLFELSSETLIFSKLMFNSLKINYSALPVDLIILEGHSIWLMDCEIEFPDNLMIRNLILILNPNSFYLSNCSFYGNPLSPPSLIVISVKYSLSSSIFNLTISNILCYNNPQNIGEQTGAIVFLQTEDMIPVDINNSILILGVQLKNVSMCFTGCLGIININTISIINGVFFGVEAQKPGAIAILCSKQAIFTNLSIEYAVAQSAAGVYLYKVQGFKAFGLSFKGNSVVQAGGCICFESVFSSYISNSAFLTSSAQDSGVFDVVLTNLTLNQVVVGFSAASNQGGVVMLSQGSVSFNNCSFFSLFADSGGVFYALLGSFFNMTACIVLNSSVSGDGAVGMVKDLVALYVDNVTLKGIAAINGSGNIYIENLNFNAHFLSNVLFLDSDIPLGACLYYNSNDRMTIQNISLKGANGVLFYLVSPIGAHILISHFEIIETNENYTGNMQVFYVKNLNFNVSCLQFSKGIARTSIFEIYASNFSFENSNIFNLTQNFSILELRILSVTGSNVSLKNDVFSNSGSLDFSSCLNQKPNIGFLKILSSSIVIHNCSFSNGLSSENAPFYVQTSSILVEDSAFVCNKGKTSGVFYVLYSNVEISGSVFKKNSGNSSDLVVENYNGFLAVGLLNITLQSCIFLNSATGSSILIDMAYGFNILECSLTGMGNSALQLSKVTQVLLKDNEFTGFQSNYGGLLLIHDQLLKDGASQNINLINNLFELNSALVGGVFYVMGDYNILISQNNFLGNEAIYINKTRTGIAAIGYIYCSSQSIIQIIVESNVFKNNYAQAFIPLIFSFIPFYSTINNTLLNNSDALQFSNGFSSFPLKAFYLDFTSNNVPLSYDSFPFIELTQNISSYSFLIESVSGQSTNFSLILTDYYNQQLLFDNSAYAKSDISSTTKLSIEKDNSESEYGILAFQSVIFYLEPGSTASINYDLSILTSSYLPIYSVDLEIYLPVMIHSRLCIIGEKYSPTDFSCIQCPVDQFSLLDPMVVYKQMNLTVKCLDCPLNAFCYNGSSITPLSGYWRNSNGSTLIVECICSDACLGYVTDRNLTVDEKVNGVCDIHQMGPLCYICEKGFARLSSKKRCEICDGNPWVYAKIILAILGISFYIYLQVKLTFKANQTTYMGILLKLLMNHLQQISMISLINLGWTPDFNVYLNFQQYFSFISEDFISIDCFVQNLPFDLLAQKVVFSNILPILLSVISFVVWIFSWSLQLVLKRTPLKNYFLNRTKVTTLIVTYLLFPEILRKCFSLLNCILIDDSTNEQALLLSPEIKCWQSTHINFLLIGSIPGLTVWGVITPVFLSYLLVRFRKNIKENIEIMQRKFELMKNLNQLTKKNLISKKSSDLTSEKSLQTQKFIKPDVTIFQKLKAKNFNEVPSAASLKKIPKEKPKIGLQPKSKKRISRLDFKNVNAVRENNPPSINIMKASESNNNLPGGEFSSPTLLNLLNFKRNALVENEQLKERLQREISINLESLNEREAHLQKEFGSLLKFLYKGYAPNFYYWEIVLYIKKFLLIFIGSFSEFFPSTTKATILLIILTYFLFLQTKKKPFETNFLNNIEYFSLIVTFVTSNIGIMLFTKDLNQYGQGFLAIVIFVNAAFFVFWGYYFYVNVILSNELGVLSKIRTFTACMKSILAKFCVFLEKTRKKIAELRVFKGERKIIPKK